MTNTPLLCIDCLMRPPVAVTAVPPRRLNRRVVIASPLAGLALCVVTYALLPSREPPSNRSQEQVRVVAAQEAEPVGEQAPSSSPDSPQPSTPAPTVTTRTNADPLDEPRQLPSTVTLTTEKKEPKEVPVLVVKQPAPRRLTPESDLLLVLAEAPEVGLGTTGPTVLTSYVAGIRQNVQVKGTPNLADPTPLIRARPDLRNLPLRAGSNCQLNVKEAESLGSLSRKLRVYLNTTAAPDGSPRRDTSVALLRQALISDKRGQRPEWLRPEAVPTLLQMLMPEEAPVRKLLIDLLAEIPHASTTAFASMIPDLGIELQDKVRIVLLERLSRLDTADLRKCLSAADQELRRAAVLASSRKKDRTLVPDLIAQLEEADPADATLIEEALHGLTGEKQDGAAGWKAWWEKHAAE